MWSSPLSHKLRYAVCDTGTRYMQLQFGDQDEKKYLNMYRGICLFTSYPRQ